MAASMDTTCDLYTCAVCLDTMIERSPRILSCLHTFCLRCLQALPVSGSCLECPTCRRKTTLENEDVNKLPVNFMLIQMQEHIQRLLCNKESVCHLCRSSFAQQKCRNCTHLLCNSCIDKHSELEQFKNHSFEQICQIHPEGIQSYICLKCVEPVCSLCILINHSEHEKDVKTCNNGIVSLKANISEWTKEAREKLKLAKDRHEKNKKNMDKTDELEANVKELIKEYTKRQDEANRILVDIQSHSKSRRDILNHDENEIEKYQGLLAGLLNFKVEGVIGGLKEYKFLQKESEEKLHSDDTGTDDCHMFTMASPIFDLSNDGKTIKTRDELQFEDTSLKTITDLKQSLKDSERRLQEMRTENTRLQQHLQLFRNHRTVLRY